MRLGKGRAWAIAASGLIVLALAKSSAFQAEPVDAAMNATRLGAGPAPNHSIERLDKPIVGYTVPDGAYYVGFAVDVNNVIAEDSDANNLIFTNNPTLAVNSEPILIQGTDRDDTITLSPGADVAGRPQIVARMNNLTVARSNVFRAHPIQIRLHPLGINDELVDDAR